MLAEVVGVRLGTRPEADEATKGGAEGAGEVEQGERRLPASCCRCSR
jgi:hypothetical protein